MMETRLLDTITVITAIVLLPMVGASAYAYLTGGLQFADYAAMWREPVALLLGFWLRGVDR